MVFLHGGAVVFRREEGETVGVIEAALPAREPEEDHRADDEEQAHEHLQNQDVHVVFFPRVSCAVVARTVVSELTGMSTAHQSGVMSPASASVTVMTL